MNFTKVFQAILSIAAAAFVLVVATAPTAARANIYATNVRLNGDTNDVTVATGGQVGISYILNEPATLGVTVDILAGTNIVRTLSLTNGQPGTLRGTNTVNWDLRGNGGGAVTTGVYSVRITAATGGYTNWTQITDDNNPGNYVWDGRGIGADGNPNSPYYGRVFVANSTPGGNGLPGDNVGLLKLNADGSEPEEGAFTTGGYNWLDSGYSPWHLQVSDDEHVYVEDLDTLGVVLRWDPTLSTNSFLTVLDSRNWATNNSGFLVTLSGPAISGSATNGALWMADAGDGSLGILRYTLTTNGTVAPNDFGTPVVGVTNDVNATNSLNLQPYDVALDKAGNIYTVQETLSPGDPHPRVLRFPAYNPATNGGAPEFIADWAIGVGDNTMGRASGIAVDPSGTYVAASFRGIDFGNIRTNGCTQIFFASNGILVTNLDLGIEINGGVTHEDTDVAWDAVGNVYYIDTYNFVPVWRAFSPPGANQATTRALPTIQVSGGGPAGPVEITGITVSGGMVTLRFTASPTDSASSFALLASPVAEGPYTNTLATATPGTNPGDFQVIVPVSPTRLFYRIQRQGTVPSSDISFTGISLSGQSVTLQFTASASAAPSAFTILASPTAAGPYSPLATPVVAGAGPGEFKATVPINSSDKMQFYRIRK